MIKSNRSRILIACCGAHLIQDGLVALQYVLLPILAQVFSLSYAQVGLLRAVSTSVMSALEIPSGVLAEKFGEPKLLVFGLFCAGAGYFVVAYADSFYWIIGGFSVAGIGAAFQHSLASSLITGSFDRSGHRPALGVYNSSGDLGKLTYTALLSLGLGIGLAWNFTVAVLSFLAIAFAIFVPALTRSAQKRGRRKNRLSRRIPGPKSWGVKNRKHFFWLNVTVSLDSLIQAVFLTYIAFVLIEKGSGESLASIAVVLTLTGGMVGKFCSGFLAARLGDRNSFLLLQILTIGGLLLLPVFSSLVTLLFLPFLGLVIQGTSTVTYGSVSDFIDIEYQARGYALIYTLSGITSVTGPFLFGYIADNFGLDSSLNLLAVLACVTLPTSFVLRSK
ncbi:MAG: MFS transporter [Gammaproteobacteria bacterium]|nr:MFS transporter [Gammaproteobacteria bacterium]